MLSRFCGYAKVQCTVQVGVLYQRLDVGATELMALRNGAIQKNLNFQFEGSGEPEYTSGI